MLELNHCLKTLSDGGVEENSDLRVIMDKELKNFLVKVSVIVILTTFLY